MFRNEDRRLLGYITVTIWCSQFETKRVPYYEDDDWNNIEKRVIIVSGRDGRLTLNGIHYLKTEKLPIQTILRKGNQFVYLPPPNYVI